MAALVVIGCLVVWKMDYLMGKTLELALENATGSPAKIGAFRLHFQDNSLEIRDLMLFDPPGFREEPWLHFSEIYLATQPPSPGDTNPLRWREIRLNLAELALVVNRQGKTNLTELVQRSSGKEISAESLTNWVSAGAFGGVDRLVLSVGKLEYLDLRNPSASQELRFGMTNRVFSNLTKPEDFQPIAMELLMRAVAGVLTRPNDSALPQLLRQMTR